MSQYSETYQQLLKIRKEKKQLADQVTDVKESLQRAEETIFSLTRKRPADDPDLKGWEDRKSELADSLSKKKQQYNENKAAELDLLKQYSRIVSPEEQIAECQGHNPILMMPVRIETIFQTPSTTGAENNELWIRFFPDDVFIETHEAGLTPEELEDAKNYWREYWRAGNSREGHLGAWRAVCRSYGAYRAAYITRMTKPINQDEMPGEPLKEGESLPVEPQFPEVNRKEESWSQPPQATAMPDYFVCMLYNDNEKVIQETGNPITDPLIVGPDPASEEDEGMRQEDDQLVVDDEMQWMVDFEEAIRLGMGMKVQLTPEQAESGFDRIIVTGIRFSMDEEQGRQKLEHLLENHHYAEDGFSFIPQGTPTNNTGEEKAGFTSFSLDEEAIFDAEHAEKQFDESAVDWENMADGLLFARYLGIDPNLLQHIQHSGTFDLRDARAMNTALWPATMEYFLDEMMDPVVPDPDIRSTENYFKNFVFGRSILPSIRIGNQPYGVVPVTAFKNVRFPAEDTYVPLTHLSTSYDSSLVNLFVSRLHALLNKLDEEWEQLVQQVSYVGKSGDPHQHLLDILGLHATSVDFFHRYSSGPQYHTNYLNMVSTNTASISWYNVLSEKISSLQEALGFRWKETPAILEKVFYSHNTHLNGPVIDDKPYSENNPVRVYSENGYNYIEWLIRNSLDTITQQDFGAGKPAPNALLYLLLRHATMQVYNKTSNRMHHEIDPNYSRPRETSEFMHMGASPAVSKFRYLYDYNTDITEGEELLVGEYISRFVNDYIKNPDIPLQSNLGEIIEHVDALNILKDLPTAKLERIFAEHIDLCSYRLDAWKQGVANMLLHEARYRREDDENEASLKQGIYLGAYGWVENIRPSSQLSEKSKDEVPEEFREVDKIFTNTNNGGYIHAPSMNHAVTAGVLRNAYLSHAGEENADAFAVNLSSERVRIAQNLMDGIRNGQELGALLGYMFERGLHDKHELAELDKFIYPLRKKFPLVADKLTRSSDDTSIQSIEARNVLNGIDLLEYIEKQNNASYPFGFTDLPSANTTEKKAIDAEVNRIADALDAVSDLALSEGVYQVVRGNYDRGGAMLQAVSEGGNPSEPEIVNTPRSGYALNHRVGLHFDANIDYKNASAANPFHGRIPYTPRSAAEAGVNNWLSQVLPDPAQVRVLVEHPASSSDDTAVESEISQEQLGLQPIDLLYVLNREMESEQTELDLLIGYFIKKDHNLDDSSNITIKYTKRPASWDSSIIGFFELMPLVEHLKALITKSKPLAADDIHLPSEGHEMSDNPKHYDITEIKERAQYLVDLYENTYLKNLDDALQTIKGASSPTPDMFNTLREALLAINGFGIAESIPTVMEDNAEELTGLAERILDKANEKLDQYKNEDLSGGSDRELTEAYMRAVNHLFEDNFRVIPRFTLPNQAELSKSYSDHSQLTQHVNDDFPMDKWMNSLARVREPMNHLHQVIHYADVFQTLTPELLPIQLPYIENDKWLGLEYGKYEFETDKLLYSFHYPGNWDPAQSQAGLLLDDWVEVVPTEKETSGLALNYNTPNAEAPQTLLVAVAPNINENWKWNDLEAILNETLDNAKKRAVEPDMIDDSKYAQFLPATMVAVTRHLITISTNLAINNEAVYKLMNDED